MMEVPDLIENAAARFPNRAAVVEGDRSLTFTEVDDRASRLAGAWRHLDVEEGERVALLAQNELEYLEIQVAAQRAGVTLVPLNFRLAVPELRYVLEDCEARLLIHGPGYGEQAANLDTPTWHLGGDGVGESYEDLVAWADRASAIELEPDTPTTILYTSGTTGRPKGAVLTNANLHARVNLFGLEYGMRPGDVFVQALPMFHIASNVSYSFAYMGCTNVMVRDYDPVEVLDLIAGHDATHVLLVPTMINQIVNHPAVDSAQLGTLRQVQYGASTIPPEVLRRAIEVFRCGFVQTYGSTEVGCATALREDDHDPDRHPDRLSAAGTDGISMRTRIVDLDGNDVATGDVGEILVRGPGVMVRYWNDPETTEKTLRDGWMHMGDLGYRSEEGYLYVTDRLKDMIISGGENVYPREVEDALYEHPAVLEAAVIGVPDEDWGERVHAVLVLRDGGELTAEKVKAHSRERLAGYKLPKSVEFRDELPKNVTGKILKTELREPYWEGEERRVR